MLKEDMIKYIEKAYFSLDCSKHEKFYYNFDIEMLSYLKGNNAYIISSVLNLLEDNQLKKWYSLWKLKLKEKQYDKNNKKED